MSPRPKAVPANHHHNNNNNNSSSSDSDSESSIVTRSKKKVAIEQTSSNNDNDDEMVGDELKTEEQPVTPNLPYLVWHEVLLRAVVDDVMGGRSVFDAVYRVSVVSPLWRYVTSTHKFRRSVLARVYARDPSRRYRQKPRPVRCRGLNVAGIDLMTKLRDEFFIIRSGDHHNLQVYDCDSYSEQRGSVVMHHCRTVGLSGPFAPRSPEILVSCPLTNRLYLLDGDDAAPSYYVCVADPVTGDVGDAWAVDKASLALVVGPDGLLVLTLPDRLEVYRYNDRSTLVRTLRMKPSLTRVIKEAMPVPGGSNFLICYRSRQGFMKSDRLDMVSDVGLLLARYTLAHVDHAQGYLVDSFGCVVLVAGDGHEATVRLLKAESLRPGNELLAWNEADPDWTPGVALNDEEYWREMWLDSKRGLLFIWTPDKTLTVHYVDAAKLA